MAVIAVLAENACQKIWRRLIEQTLPGGGECERVKELRFIKPRRPRLHLELNRKGFAVLRDRKADRAGRGLSFGVETEDGDDCG